MYSDLIVERRLLKVEKVIGDITVRRTVEAEITLPFKALKVFEVIASVTDVKTEVREGGVLVSGVIHKQIFVVDLGDVVRHVPEDVPFEEFIAMPGVLKDMDAQVNTRILTVDTELNKDRLKQTVVLEIFIKVTVTEQIEVVLDVSGPGIIVKKELLKVDSVVGEDTQYFTLTPTVTLPITAKKIFRIIPSVRDVSAEVREDTVIVRGVIHKQVFLVDEGDLVRHAAENISFTKTVDIPGVRKGMEAMVNISVTLEDHELLYKPGKELRQTLVLDVFVKVTETLQLEVVVDVKGPDIKVIKKLLKVESVVVDVLQQETVRATVYLPQKPTKILEIIGEIVGLEAEVRTDQVLVKGILHKQIFFVDEAGDLLRHYREDVPFRFVKTAPGARPGMNVQVRARIIGEIIHRLSEKKLEQTAIIEIFAKVTRTVQTEVVINVIRVAPPRPPVPPLPPRPPVPPHPPVPPKPPVPPVKKYIVQKGDTLFFIAKRFGVSLDALIRANPQIQNPDLIFPGDVVFIPHAPVFPPVPGRQVTVQKGDTLFLIAKRFGISLDALIRANPQIKNPDLIFPGDTVFIP